jgi:hypothetical protein
MSVACSMWTKISTRGVPDDILTRLLKSAEEAVGFFWPAFLTLIRYAPHAHRQLIL